MNSSAAVEIHHHARRADRRPGLHALVRQVAADLAAASTGATDLGSALASRLRALTQVKHVQVTEVPINAPLRAGHPVMTHDYAAFAVPTRSGRQLVLEVSFMPGVRPDDWTCQLLETAASLAAITYEAERGMPHGAAMLSPHHGDVGPLIGASEVMQALRERLERVASTDFTILIEGESGVGKELVARQIHACSRRRQGPFVAINCAALVETLIEAELFGIEERTATGVRGRRGKFEHADGGTLFLDEVSDLSLSAQAKLLRAIQDLTVERVGGTGGRRVDVRIVAATNRGLAGLVSHGLFRADLFYRLSGVEVMVPPLRLRKTDVLELTQYFLSRHQARGRLTMTTAAVDALDGLRLARQRPRARAHDRGRGGDCGVANHSARRPAGQPARRLRRDPDAVRPGRRVDAVVGQPVCAPDAREVPGQQARGLPAPGDFLSHAERVSALPAGATSGWTATGPGAAARGPES